MRAEPRFSRSHQHRTRPRTISGREFRNAGVNVAGLSDASTHTIVAPVWHNHYQVYVLKEHD
jgi:hypothetical protein